MDQAAVLNQSLPWQPVLPQKHLGTVLRPIDLNSFMVTARRLQTFMARNPGDSIRARKAMADGAASNQIPGFRSNPRLWLAGHRQSMQNNVRLKILLLFLA